MRRNLVTAAKRSVTRVGANNAKFMGALPAIQCRGFEKHLNLDSTQNLLPAEYEAKDQVALWKESSGAGNALELSNGE